VGEEPGPSRSGLHDSDKDRRARNIQEIGMLAELIIDQTGDALIFADKAGVVTRWNCAAVTLFGYSAAEALEQTLDLIIPEPLRAAHWRGFEAAISSGRTRLHGCPTFTRVLHKNGHSLYVEMTFALVQEPDGTVLGSVAVARSERERVGSANNSERDHIGI
jgi:PAS domain S-box-containing protein